MYTRERGRKHEEKKKKQVWRLKGRKEKGRECNENEEKKRVWALREKEKGEIRKNTLKERMKSKPYMKKGWKGD